MKATTRDVYINGVPAVAGIPAKVLTKKEFDAYECGFLERLVEGKADVVSIESVNDEDGRCVSLMPTREQLQKLLDALRALTTTGAETAMMSWRPSRRKRRK